MSDQAASSSSDATTGAEGEVLTLHVTVPGISGSPRIPVVVSPSVTSAQLRRVVSDATSIPPSHMRLIYRGRIVPDDPSQLAVPEFKLENGSVLHCMGKPVPQPPVPPSVPSAAPSFPSPREPQSQ
jgi:hypothetical protein